MKVLIFTSSHHVRGSMLRYSLLDILNQSHTDFTYALSLKTDSEVNQWNKLLIDDIVDSRVVFSILQNNRTSVTHNNAIDTIKSVTGYSDYDLFIKKDDDDIFKKDYVKTVVEFFEANPDVDFTSSMIYHQLNGNRIFSNPNGFSTLGRLFEEDLTEMPMTFAFNKRAFDLIANLPGDKITGEYDDMIWRKVWYENKLIHKPIDNRTNIIWNIHGGNISTASFLRK